MRILVPFISIQDSYNNAKNVLFTWDAIFVAGMSHMDGKIDLTIDKFSNL